MHDEGWHHTPDGPRRGLIEPPWAAEQIARAIVSPSPVPLVSPRTNSSKMRSRSGERHTRPVVGDSHDAPTGTRRSRSGSSRHDHLDLGASWSEPERILQQHDDDQLEHRRVDLGEHLGRLLVEPDPYIGTDMTQAVHRLDRTRSPRSVLSSIGLRVPGTDRLSSNTF